MKKMKLLCFFREYLAINNTGRKIKNCLGEKIGKKMVQKK